MDVATAVAKASEHPGRIATLIVCAVAVDTAEMFHKAMVDSTREPGPSLIEVRL